MDHRVGTVGDALARASASFNRIPGDGQTDTAFAVGIYAYAGSPSTFPSQWLSAELDSNSGSVTTDDDTGTWESATAELDVPVGTSFLVVRVSALENTFNDASGTEFDGHYADAAFLEIVPEPATLSLLALGAFALIRHKRRRPQS